MATSEDKVMQFVEKELQKKTAVKTADLYERAKKVDPEVAKLSLRQFNARYPLQVKRRKSASAPSRRKKASGKKPRATRKRSAKGKQEAVREVFLKFAADLSAAEARKDLVKVLAQVDGYVEQAMKAAGR